ncbi:MAG: helix-hairpin-helix domain-containing protein [Desulfobulbaceae bacterium]|nr:helix-hairpin-helix domain-containing protein [Desulfobulbaceae bacterium]
MNRTGERALKRNDASLERNLRYRILLLALFAIFLVGVNFLPLHRQSGPGQHATLLLQLGSEDTPWQLSLVPQQHLAEAATLVVGSVYTMEQGAELAGLNNSCSTPPEFALFLGLPLDINRAEAKDFQLLPGIGPVLAQRIVAEREARGLYKKTEAMQRVSGIGATTLARLQPYICVR